MSRQETKVGRLPHSGGSESSYHDQDGNERASRGAIHT